MDEASKKARKGLMCCTGRDPGACNACPYDEDRKVRRLNCVEEMLNDVGQWVMEIEEWARKLKNGGGSKSA